MGHAHAPFACATVGMLQVHPNSRNVIPGRVFFTVDLRHPDDAVLAAMDAELREGIERVAAEAKLESTRLEQIFYYAPISFDADCVASVRAATEALGYPHRDMVSGAGHDACWTNRVAPSTMIMCPCVDGLSHNEAEEITPEWAEKGANVLFHAVVETAETSGSGQLREKPASAEQHEKAEENRGDHRGFPQPVPPPRLNEGVKDRRQ